MQSEPNPADPIHLHVLWTASQHMQLSRCPIQVDVMLGKSCAHRWPRTGLFQVDLGESEGQIANAVFVASSGLLLRAMLKNDGFTGRNQATVTQCYCSWKLDMQSDIEDREVCA